MNVRLGEAGKVALGIPHIEITTNTFVGQVFSVLWQVTEEGLVNKLQLTSLSKTVMDSNVLAPAFADHQGSTDVLAVEQLQWDIALMREARWKPLKHNVSGYALTWNS